MQGRPPARAERPEATHHRPVRPRHRSAPSGSSPRRRPRPSPTSTTSQARVDSSTARPSRPRSATTTPSSSSQEPPGRPGLAAGRPGAPGQGARRGPRPGPGLHRAPVRGREPLRRRPGHRLRGPAGVPRPAVDDVGLQRHAGRPLRPVLHRGSRPSTCARDGHRERTSRDREDRGSMLADEKATVDKQLADGRGPARRAQGRGARGDPVPRQHHAGALRRRRPRVAPARPSSYAMAQVGDAYVYGAAGPSAFDCSGLTMMAWAQAGVALPHSSSAQYSSGTPVSPRRPAARRPGLLLQPDQPRRHVHRQRHDRERRQPGRRRPGLGPARDAVRRRRPARLIRTGPPRLATSTPKAGRPRWWVAGLSLCLLLVGRRGWCWRCCRRPVRRPATARPGPTVSADPVRRSALDTSSSAPARRRGRRARSPRRTTRRARTGSPRSWPTRPRCGCGTSRCATSRTGRRRRGLDGRPSTRPGASPASTGPRLGRGLGRSPRRRRAGRADRLGGGRAASRRCGCPGRSRCVVRPARWWWSRAPRPRRDRYAALAHGRRPGGPAGAPAVGPRTGRRGARHRRRTSSAALGAEPGTYDQIAAVTTSVDGTTGADAPVHVFVNPDVFGSLEPTGAQVVMSHEATHVATDAATSRAADVAAGGVRRLRRAPRRRPAASSPRPPRSSRRYARRAARVRCPDAADFESAGDRPRRDVRERLAGLPAARRGRAARHALVALYRAVDGGEPLPGQPSRRRFGRSVPDLHRAVAGPPVRVGAVSTRREVSPDRRVAWVVTAVGALGVRGARGAAGALAPRPGRHAGPGRRARRSSPRSRSAAARTTPGGLASGAGARWWSRCWWPACSASARPGRRLVARLPGSWWVRVVLAVAALELVGRLVDPAVRGAAAPTRPRRTGSATSRGSASPVTRWSTRASTIVVTSLLLIVLIGCARRWARRLAGGGRRHCSRRWCSPARSSTRS